MEVVGDVRRLSGNLCRDLAQLLYGLNEIEDRRVHLEDGYSSMYGWCMGELQWSEDMACKRLRIARAARTFTAILDHLAESRLNVSGLMMLIPHLTPANADQLLAESAHRSNAQLGEVLARHFPRPDVPTTLAPVAAAVVPARSMPTPTESRGASEATSELAPAPPRVPESPEALDAASELPAVRRVDVKDVSPAVPSIAATTESGGACPPPVTRPRIHALSPGRYALQLTISAATRELLERARDLLGHAVPSGDLDEVLARALQALIEKHEKRRFGVGAKPRVAAVRPARMPSPDPRAISAELRRAIHARDGGRCTFVSTGGRRCGSRMRLEIHHVANVASGGRSTLANLALRCRAHNQHQADRDFGAGFMREQREAAAAQRGDTRR